MIAQATYHAEQCFNFPLVSVIIHGLRELLRMYARVVELVDTLALGASAFGREGSSPFARTK